MHILVLELVRWRVSVVVTPFCGLVGELTGLVAAVETNPLVVPVDPKLSGWRPESIIMCPLLELKLIQDDAERNCGTNYEE